MNPTLDAQIDELLCRFDTIKQMKRNSPTAWGMLVAALITLIEQESKKAKFDEARYVENYFDGEEFYANEWQDRIQTLRTQLTKGDN